MAFGCVGVLQCWYRSRIAILRQYEELKFQKSIKYFKKTKDARLLACIQSPFPRMIPLAVLYIRMMRWLRKVRPDGSDEVEVVVAPFDEQNIVPLEGTSESALPRPHVRQPPLPSFVPETVLGSAVLSPVDEENDVVALAEGAVLESDDTPPEISAWMRSFHVDFDPALSKEYLNYKYGVLSRPREPFRVIELDTTEIQDLD